MTKINNNADNDQLGFPLSKLRQGREGCEAGDNYCSRRVMSYDLNGRGKKGGRVCLFDTDALKPSGDDDERGD